MWRFFNKLTQERIKYRIEHADLGYIGLSGIRSSIFLL